MIEAQPIVEITPETLVAKVREMRHQCYRLVQIGATPCKETVEVNYSFDRDGRFITLRVRIPALGAILPSVSEVYWCAFIYENELHDLFKIEVIGNAVDYKGQFYKTAVPFAFAPTAAPALGVPASAGSAATTPAQPAAPLGLPASAGSASPANPPPAQ